MILGNVVIALDRLDRSSTVRDNIRSIENASRRAADLADQMLAYSGRGQFILATLDIRELVTEISDLLKVTISKKVKLRFDYAEDTPAIVGDPNQIRQIVMNLITNASEAIGDDTGTITLSTGRKYCSESDLQTITLTAPVSPADQMSPGDYSFIEVVDTGCGMDRETVERVFDPFFTTKFVGRGLGMSAVQGIIRGHGGAITIESEPANGTRVTVLLPVANSESSDEPAETNRRPEALDWRGEGTLLLVDDDENVLKIGKILLERLGFEVLTSADGHEAVSRYRDRQKDIRCMLLDLTMPVKSGLEVFTEIKELDPDARIIMCSGYSEQEIPHDVSRESDGFLHKPFQLEELRQKLMSILH